MRVVVLTGAGVSAESGVPTFRDADGLWEGHRVEDVATPEAFDAQPSVVHRFYDARRAALAEVEPNPAHRALARLEEMLGDDLLARHAEHRRPARARRLPPGGAHARRAALGALPRLRQRMPWSDALHDYPPCPRCGVSELRPDVVWFGEIPYDMDLIFDALARADLFVSIGTSGLGLSGRRRSCTRPACTAPARWSSTWPAARAPPLRRVPAGPAGTLVPAWVDEVAERLTTKPGSPSLDV